MRWRCCPLTSGALRAPRRPDNWGLKTPEFQRSFIESHLKDAASLNKPVILEECAAAARRAAARACLRPAALTRMRRYGKITEDKPQTVRNRYFQSAHEVAEQNARTGGPLMGTLFWHWCGTGACVCAQRRNARGSTAVLLRAQV